MFSFTWVLSGEIKYIAQSMTLFSFTWVLSGEMKYNAQSKTSRCETLVIHSSWNKYHQIHSSFKGMYKTTQTEKLQTKDLVLDNKT